MGLQVSKDQHDNLEHNVNSHIMKQVQTSTNNNVAFSKTNQTVNVSIINTDPYDGSNSFADKARLGRVLNGDTGIGQKAQRCSAGEIEPQEAWGRPEFPPEFQLVLDVVAIASWYQHQVANRA